MRSINYGGGVQHEWLNGLLEDGDKPEQIRVDNGPEFLSNTFVNWCNHQRIEIRYIQPEKLVKNVFIERFNGSFRRDVLDAYIFHQVRILTQQWMYHYNYEKPHNSVKGKTPYEVAIYQKTD